MTIEDRQYEFERFVRDGVATLRTQMVQVLDVSSTSSRAIHQHAERLTANEGEWRSLHVEMRAVREQLHTLQSEVAELKAQREGMMLSWRILSAVLAAAAGVAGWAVSTWRDVNK